MSAVMWERVFDLRCRSKRGENLSESERRYLSSAFKEDRERYAAMNDRVFDETAPFGSVRRRGESK